MDINIKLLLDEFGTKEYVFYYPGKSSTPIMILTEGDAGKLLERLLKEYKKPEYIVRKA